MSIYSVLDWYDDKLQQVSDLIEPTLWLIGAFMVLVAYIAFRSWKKAALAGIGMAIVIALVSNVESLSGMVEGELDASGSAPTAQAQG